MNNYLPLVQNESFSREYPSFPGDTLQEVAHHSPNPPPIYISRGNLNPGTLIIIPRFPTLEKAARAMFISLFFFLLHRLWSLFLEHRQRRIPFVASRHRRSPSLSLIYHPREPLLHTRQPTTIHAERVISRDVDEVEVIPKGRRGRGIPPSAKGCEGSNREERVARGTLSLAVLPSTTTWRGQRRWWTPL